MALPPAPHRTCVTALALLLAALVPALVSAWLHPRAPAWQTPAETGTLAWAETQAMTDALWIDARPAEEFARGHMNTALSLPAADWETYLEAVLDAWRPGRPVIVYCGGGGCRASHAVAQRLRDELGLDNVHVLSGGWPGPTSPAP